MKFSPGERVLKAACPTGCSCDGSLIPTGSEGRIHLDMKSIRAMPNSFGQSEPHYTVTWKVKGMDRLWGTYEHGIESLDAFPDISYLEGV